MSSEAEAMKVVFAVLTDDRRDAYAMKRERQMRAALGNYKEQIERRVLAQQPCYGALWEQTPQATCGTGADERRCPPCQARAAQTQETSG